VAHTIRDRAKLLVRARRLKGQVESVERALQDGGECQDVLQQLAAIRGAANGLMASVLEGHVREHLGVRQNHELQLLLDIIQRYLR
jgi:DNA-binding FrmR family transcriptional regulator